METPEKVDQLTDAFNKEIEEFIYTTGIIIKQPKLEGNKFIIQFSEVDLKEYFDTVIKQLVLQFGKLEKLSEKELKLLSEPLKQYLNSKRNYPLSFDRKEVSEMEPVYDLQRIIDFAKTTSGGTPSRSVASNFNGYIPWIKSGEIAQGFIYEAQEHITDEGLKNSSAKLVPKNSVLVALYGATVGQVGLLKVEATTNQAVCAILPNDSYNSEYLYWILKYHREEFIKQSTGGAQQNISQKIIQDTLIPFPDIDRQKEIATELNIYNKVVEGCNSIIDNYTPIFDIDNTWEIVKLGDICTDFRNGVNFSKEQVGTGTPFINVSDVFSYDGIVNLNVLEKVNISPKEISRFNLKNNDLVFVRSSVKEEGVGFVSLVDKPHDMDIVFCGFVIKCSPDVTVVNPKFLLYLLRTEEYRLRIISQSSRATITNVSQTALHDLDIYLPSLDIQNEIVKQVESEFETIMQCRSLKFKTETKMKKFVASLWGVPAEEGEVLAEV